jgi:hypothetical protein
MLNLKIVFIAVGTLALTACVVSSYRPVRYHPAPTVYAPQDVVVDVAPPTPYEEVIPVAPYFGAVWVGGYWAWSGGRHVWTHGHYERNRPGFVYHRAGWDRDGYGHYHFRQGGWGR